MAFRVFSLFLLLMTLSACVSTGGIFGQPRIAKTVPLSKNIIDQCEDAPCLVKLAEAEKVKGQLVEKELATAAIASTHILMGDESKGLSLLDTINDQKVRNIFFKNYGSIDKGKINKFIADTQRWENVDIPLPKSLLGKHEDYDTLYAMFLLLNREVEQARRLAYSLRKDVNRNKILYYVAMNHLKADDYVQAIEIAGKMAGSSDGRHSRPRALAVIFNKMYLQSQTDGLLDRAKGFHTTSERDGAKAGIAVAMSELGQMDGAMALARDILQQTIRIRAYGEILSQTAKRGNLSKVKSLIGTVEEYDKEKISYPKITNAFAAAEHIEEAEAFLSLIPNDKQTIYSLSGLGKITRDITYFQQALVLAKNLQEQEKSRLMKGTLFISGDMAKAGYYEEAIKTYHGFKSPLLRKITRSVIYSSLYNSPLAPRDYGEILDLAELDMASSEPIEYELILKTATKFFLVDKADLAGIDRYLTLIEQVPNESQREVLQGRIIPHLAYLGEFDKINQIISKMNYTLPRILTLLRLAEFHVLKGKLNTI